MQDVFYEESAVTQSTGTAKTKYYICKTLSIVSYVIAGLWGIIMLFTFPFGEGNILLNIVFVLVPLILFVVSGMVLVKLKDKFYVDYDYTFVSGSVRFSRVIKNVKRKNIIVFETQAIEKIGKYGSATFERYSSTPDKKLLVLTSNAEPSNGKDFYYMVVNSGGQKYLFVLECTEVFLINVLKFSNRTIFEDGFFDKK